MLNVGGPELLIILLVALVFLGPQRLPEVARQMGQAMSSLKSLASGFQAELEAASRPDPDSSMTLKGPTNQSDAIAQTQQDGLMSDGSMKPQSDQAQPGASPAAVADADRAAGATKGTDPASVAKAARQVTYDDNAPKVSSGGPTNLAEMAAAGRPQPDGQHADARADVTAAEAIDHRAADEKASVAGESADDSGDAA